MYANVKLLLVIMVTMLSICIIQFLIDHFDKKGRINDFFDKGICGKK